MINSYKFRKFAPLIPPFFSSANHITSKMLIDNLRDRYNDGKNIVTVWDFIKEYIANDECIIGRFDIVTGYFTLRALAQLHDNLHPDIQYRLLSSELIHGEPYKNHVLNLLRGDELCNDGFKLQEYVRKAKEFLNRDSVHCKAITRSFCHAKVFVFEPQKSSNHGFYVTGSCNLTDRGLGLTPTRNVELAMAKATDSSDPDYSQLRDWFAEVWDAASDTLPLDRDDPNSPQVPVKEYFLMQIDRYYRQYTPAEIYYKILFELFNAELDLDASIEHHKDMSLLQTSTIWKTLFNYQQKGVISLIKTLRKYNGAILADAVGLGKTFSALAVIKFFRIQGYTTVLLCPKKLEQNWTQYLRRRNSRFESDDFDYLVRFHTDCQDDRLERRYDDAKLSWLQRNSKLLIVIDESHNLRNEKSGRYQELLQKLIQNQDSATVRDVKILMLSATPINTGLADIKGQFNLIARGDDSAFNNEDFEIDSLQNLFTDAQRKYNSWCANDNRTIGDFITSLPNKFFSLTDRLVVARTRSLIEKTLGENLGFPAKATPVNIYQGVEAFGNFGSTEDIYDAFGDLFLPVYQPTLFMEATRTKSRRAAEAMRWDDDVNRERFLVQMMRVLFMKRLESSWFSLMTTIKKVLDTHSDTLNRVKAYRNAQKNETLGTMQFDFDEEDGGVSSDMYTLRKGEIKLADMKNITGFEKALKSDINKLQHIYDGLLNYQQRFDSGAEQDRKLEQLIEILNEKQLKTNKKVVIFTVYADTAKFLYDQLRKRGFGNIAAVSGSNVWSVTETDATNYTPVLQRFAPYSKLYKELDWRDLYEEARLDRGHYYDSDKQQWNVPYDLWTKLINKYRPQYARMLEHPIDILIATDCLSEGQNLQDADMQINYDIHWNPVRLIQRFGRIDRIGSPNALIQCVNFWPAKSFEEYLNLEQRVTDRMVTMTVVGSETQSVNDKYEQMVKDNPLIDKNADRLLRELQNNSISDIESPRTLSFKDFSFELYRQDLVDYFEQHREQFMSMPNGIYSGFGFDQSQFPDMGQSLVAVLGYPHRDEKSTKPYEAMYLVCQPVNGGQAQYRELKQAEILDFLRRNKDADRSVPQWIETENPERLKQLTDLLQAWMTAKVPQQATAAILGLARSTRSLGNKTRRSPDQLLEDKFRMQNFDLIVWEYVTVNE